MTGAVREVARVAADRQRGGGRLTCLTGAGVSAESGVSTFRDQNGLWEKYPVEELASPEGFQRDPALVYRFYNVRRAQLGSIEPNPGHRALAGLEQALGKRFSLITQNVDDLHERAGSRRALHMHGELLKARCTTCDGVFAWSGDLDGESACEGCGSLSLRPHIVWFGEMPMHMDQAIPESLQTDVFISIGTSGHVYPAAGFVAAAAGQGALTVEINLEPSMNARDFDQTLYGRSGELLPAFVNELLSNLKA